MTEFLINSGLFVVYATCSLGAWFFIACVVGYVFLILKEIAYEIALFMHNDIPKDITPLVNELRARTLYAIDNNPKVFEGFDLEDLRMQIIKPQINN
jgi:hypothetical protein